MRSGIGNSPSDPIFTQSVGGGSAGPQPASGSQSVTPATDSAPFPVGGTFTTALPSLTNGQRSTLQLDGSGRLIVKVADSRFARSGFANGYNQFSSFNLFADDGGSGPLNVVSGYQDPATNTGFTARGDANGAFTVSKGSNSFATAQVSVATSATQIVAARANRGSVKITNLGTNDVYIGVAGVTTTTGDLLPGTKGASIVVPTNVAVFGIAAAAQSVSVMEVF